MIDPRTTLCLACGLCCDGNLFTSVPLRGEEVAPMRRRGLQIHERGDGTAALRQRCGALVGRRCDIYDHRPATCRSYRCMLLGALTGGEVTLSEALAIVAQAHASLAALAGAWASETTPGAVMQRARQALRDDALAADTRAAIVAAMAYLSRHFQRDASR